MRQIEPALVERAIEGDREAYGRLVELVWDPLARLARSIVGPADAEDAVQDALVRAWKRLDRLRDPARCAPWLARIVSRECLGRARWGRRWAPLEEAPETAVASGVDAALDVETLLGELAPRQRAVMHLTVVEGMADSEIGEVLGIAAGSVRAHRRRARQTLDRRIARRTA